LAKKLCRVTGDLIPLIPGFIKEPWVALTEIIAKAVVDHDF
jgi:hypothetical protein